MEKFRGSRRDFRIGRDKRGGGHQMCFMGTSLKRHSQECNIGDLPKYFRR